MITFGLIVQVLQSSAQAQKQHCKATVELDSVSLLQVGHGDVHIKKESSEKQIHPGSGSTQLHASAVPTSLTIELKASEEERVDGRKEEVRLPATKASQREESKTQERLALRKLYGIEDAEDRTADKEFTNLSGQKTVLADDEEETREGSDPDERQQSKKPEDETPSSNKSENTKQENYVSDGGKGTKNDGYGTQFWFWSFIVALVLFSIACVGWVVTSVCNRQDPVQKTECKVADQEAYEKMLRSKGGDMLQFFLQFKGVVDVTMITTKNGDGFTPDDYQKRCKEDGLNNKPPAEDFPLTFVLEMKTFVQDPSLEETSPDKNEGKK